MKVLFLMVAVKQNSMESQNYVLQSNKVMLHLIKNKPIPSCFKKSMIDLQKVKILIDIEILWGQ